MFIRIYKEYIHILSLDWARDAEGDDLRSRRAGRRGRERCEMCMYIYIYIYICIYIRERERERGRETYKRIYYMCIYITYIQTKEARAVIRAWLVPVRAIAGGIGNSHKHMNINLKVL